MQIIGLLSVACFSANAEKGKETSKNQARAKRSAHLSETMEMARYRMKRGKREKIVDAENGKQTSKPGTREK
jgi:hypothetical protein